MPDKLGPQAVQALERGITKVAARLAELPSDPGRPPVVRFDDDKHRYTLDGDFVPSVTQIIKAQDPFEAGPWWGMRVGLAAVVRLLQESQLSWPALLEEDPDEILLGHRGALEELVVKRRLSTNHVKDERGDEGIAIHHAIEQIASTGAIPVLSDFDPELRGFIQAFSQWYVDADPEIVWQELIVASRAHRYAGRADLGLRNVDLDDQAESLTIVDFKTTRRAKGPAVYPKYHLQGCGYRMAYNELLPWSPPDTPHCSVSATVVLHESGSYLARKHVCPDERWLAAVRLWHENEPFLDALKAQEGKKRRKR